MRRSTILFLVFAVLAAAGCIRLGVWQLDRREQRQAMNRTIGGRIQATPVIIDAIRGDTVEDRFKRVVVRGVPDFDREFMLTFRGNNGSPGVDIITPLRLPGQDSAVLVNRGWIYSPDGMTADLSKWHEADTTFTGYVDAFEPDRATDSVRSNGIRRMDYAAIARALPYPVRGFYVVALSDSVSASGTTGVVRLRPPKLDEGPHLNYAFQWFAFATIALLGGGIVAARSMRKSLPT